MLNIGKISISTEIGSIGLYAAQRRKNVDVNSMKSLHENEIVISFFSLLQLMVKSPASKRTIDWRLRFFGDEAKSIERDCPLFYKASRMVEELNSCRHRRRSRSRIYNMANIDQAYNNYWIHKSPTTLMDAWSLFESGEYRIGGFK